MLPLLVPVQTHLALRLSSLQSFPILCSFLHVLCFIIVSLFSVGGFRRVSKFRLQYKAVWQVGDEKATGTTRFEFVAYLCARHL